MMLALIIMLSSPWLHRADNCRERTQPRKPDSSRITDTGLLTHIPLHIFPASFLLSPHPQNKAYSHKTHKQPGQSAVPPLLLPPFFLDSGSNSSGWARTLQDSWSSCVFLQSAGITGLHHHTQFVHSFTLLESFFHCHPQPQPALSTHT